MKVARIFTVPSLSVLLLLLGTSTLPAQFNSGLEGTVFDPSGAAVPNASVALKHVSTGVEQTTVTSSAGIYRFTALPSGRFTLTVKASGFETAALSDVSIQITETRTLNVNLKVGASTQTVNVTAEVTPINSSTGAVSGQINDVKVHELPLVGRNMFSLVVLTPGVTGLPSGGGQAYAQATADIFNAEYGVNLNANGQRAESNSFTVDGATTNGNPRGGVTNLTPNADSIQEVQIQTNNFSAQYGRNAAAIVNVETKSGTNVYHGTLSWFHTDTHLNARTVYQPDRPVFLRNEFAGSAGGPIRKEKDFVFGSVDILRSGVGVAFPAQIPSANLISFLKTNLPSNISTNVLGSFPTTFQANRLFTTAGADVGSSCTGTQPIGSFGSATSGLVTSGPLTTMPCDTPVSGIGDFSNTVFRNGIQWSSRIDHYFNDLKDRLYGSFFRTTRQTVLFASPSVYFPKFSPAEPEYTHLLNLNWTHSAGANFVNQMTASYTRTFGDAPCGNCEVPAMGTDDGTALGAFLQDDFKIKPNLTINMGLRWEAFTGPTERFARLNNGVFQGGATWQDRIADMKMDHVPQLWHTRVGNLAPRVGFAWDPTKKGKISIRGGTGIFYDRSENQLYTGDRNNLPLVANANCSLLSAQPCTPAFGLGASGTSPYDFPPVPGLQVTGLDAKNGLIGTRTSQVLTDQYLQTQYGENWSLGVQYEVFHDWLAEGDYLG